MVYLILFISAVLLTNAIPHFVKGITGEKHMTPFAKPSSAMVNVLWGLLNVIVGYYLLMWALTMDYERPLADIVFIAGAASISISLARFWQDDPKARGR